MEEGKDSSNVSRTNHSTALPNRLIKFLVLFLVLCSIFSVFGIYKIKHSGAIDNVVDAVKPSIQQPEPTIQPKPCVKNEISSNLDQLIKPPSNLFHSMNDKDLLWRASFAPSRKEYPFKLIPKIAFMFLTKGELPFAPLWERFFNGHDGLYSIYVHSMPSYEASFSTSSVFYKRQIPSQVAEWGQMSLSNAERRLLANALLDITNTRFILLSESCIPLYNFTIIYHYLMKSRHSFVDSFDDPGPCGRGRYNHHMEPEVNISQWRKGSQWFEVNRELALQIVADTKYHQKFDEFCKLGCYVDEHYFPTLLTIRAPDLLANRSITWVDWSRGGAHPGTFGAADITEEFMRRILENNTCIYNDKPSSICYLFARKFAPNALEQLFVVASKYLGF